MECGLSESPPAGRLLTKRLIPLFHSFDESENSSKITMKKSTAFGAPAIKQVKTARL
jgi:hypothetical protein